MRGRDGAGYEKDDAGQEGRDREEVGGQRAVQAPQGQGDAPAGLPPVEEFMSGQGHGGREEGEQIVDGTECDERAQRGGARHVRPQQNEQHRVEHAKSAGNEAEHARKLSRQLSQQIQRQEAHEREFRGGRQHGVQGGPPSVQSIEATPTCIRPIGSVTRSSSRCQIFSGWRRAQQSTRYPPTKTRNVAPRNRPERNGMHGRLTRQPCRQAPSPPGSRSGYRAADGDLASSPSDVSGRYRMVVAGMANRTRG